MNKNNDEEYVIDEDKFRGLSSIRQESELFDDESHIVHDLVNVKYTELSKGDIWEITQNKKPTVTLNGTRFTKKEKTFLKSPQGMSFLIKGYREGWKTATKFKKEIKNFL